MWLQGANSWAHSSDLSTLEDSRPTVLARRHWSGHQALGASCRTTADGGLPSSHRPEDLAQSSHRTQKKKKTMSKQISQFRKTAQSPCVSHWNASTCRTTSTPAHVEHSTLLTTNTLTWSSSHTCPTHDRLAGPVVKASALGAEDLGFESHLRQDFSGVESTSDLKIGTPVATLPDPWHYRVSAGTDRPSTSIL